MKIKLSRRSAVVVVAAIVMLVLGGSALAQSGPTATRSAHHGKIKYRFGKIVDTDTTANDGQFNYAHGHANCKHNERLISGGLRLAPRQHHGDHRPLSDGGIRPDQTGMG